VRGLFRDLWHNDDVVKYRRGVAVVDGKHAWLHEGTIPHAELGIGVAEQPAEEAGAPPVAAR
jgi:hypothetical protein